ncbi:non-homologous end-joining DNA ligase [Nitratireductor sp. ZSWI3]|uniref:non-homologous end-joining DNA ligase n=1 Tax=Nitratireductor sp. ZSWI3 TaxID=2966359 RepID=UPI00214FA1F2|nr:non-homologous end-joining DNA ligase [Nitratireductor sp. ZSWI3]MCR4267751.1 non-homologous end-joining DNA ligase [Nitratireductor sp. ZSWI3]
MNDQQRIEIAGIGLSSPDKVLFADQGVTKLDLARHYQAVANRILPHMKNRLVSLVRCPDGRRGQCFFQRHGGKGFPQAVKRRVIREKSGGTDEYLYVSDLSGIVAAVQMNALEFHIWGARIDRLEQPDRLVFDLDPDESIGFAAVRDAAFILRARLRELDLETVPLVTGGKGIHLVAPLQRRAEWADVKAFARAFAEDLAHQAPEVFLAQASKAKRQGRIFIDWLRNERGATAIAPYSTRARKGAPVATPVSWDELSGLKGADGFHIGDMEKRLEAPDPWQESTGWRQSITRTMLKAVGADA